MSPYIKQDRRKELDPYIDKLVEEAQRVGELNYIVTKVLYGYVCKFADKEGVSYSAYNAIIGVLECAKLEMYRMAVSKLENKKIKENGGIYES